MKFPFVDASPILMTSPFRREIQIPDESQKEKMEEEKLCCDPGCQLLGGRQWSGARHFVQVHQSAHLISQPPPSSFYFESLCSSFLPFFI